MSSASDSNIYSKQCRTFKSYCMEQRCNQLQGVYFGTVRFGQEKENQRKANLFILHAPFQTFPGNKTNKSVVIFPGKIRTYWLTSEWESHFPYFTYWLFLSSCTFQSICGLFTRVLQRKLKNIFLYDSTFCIESKHCGRSNLFHIQQKFTLKKGYKNS